MGLRLGISLCKPHQCHQCRVEVDHLALYGLSCKKSQGSHPRHAAVNILLKRSLASAKIPSFLEPTGIAHCDGKRPDTFASSHMALAAREAGLVASEAEKAKIRITPFSAPLTTSSRWPSNSQEYLGLRPFPSSRCWGARSGKRLAIRTPCSFSCRASLLPSNA